MPVDKITLINVDPPQNADINAELQWLGAALGLFGQRDKDSSCFRIFITFVNSANDKQTLSSDEIANRCKLSRGTVVHHINRLRDAGLVIPGPHGYRLSAQNIHASLNKMEEELNQMMRLMQAVAKDIDKKLG
jgi:biotin operon repressor